MLEKAGLRYAGEVGAYGVNVAHYEIAREEFARSERLGLPGDEIPGQKNRQD